MFLHALATAVPQNSLSQPECWDLIERSPVRQRLSKRSRLILHSVLRGDHGIDRRHFAVRQLDRIFDLTADELNAAFRVEAPHLAEQALLGAMRHANIDAGEIDALLICTCSGYLCPGVTSYVAEDLGLRSDAYLQDLVGLGCGAAIPSLRSASYILAARPDAVVACVAVEVCSARLLLGRRFWRPYQCLPFRRRCRRHSLAGQPRPIGPSSIQFRYPSPANGSGQTALRDEGG